jgi:hypothetical protein
MPVSERAKQFAPFSPLNGLSKALRKQERMPMPKPALCDDQVACLNQRLCALKPGMEITVLFYRDEEVRKTCGKVLCLQPDTHILQLCGQVILFDELLEICGADFWD